MSRQVDELIQDVIDFGRRCNDLVEFTYKRTCGFSTNQMHVVVFIYRKGGSIYQKDLDDFIRLSKPAISQAQATARNQLPALSCPHSVARS